MQPDEESAKIPYFSRSEYGDAQREENSQTAYRLDVFREHNVTHSLCMLIQDLCLGTIHKVYSPLNLSPNDHLLLKPP